MTTDREYQLGNLQKIFDDATCSPVFKRNSKFEVTGMARVPYRDVMDNKYTIYDTEGFDFNRYWDGDTKILAEYASLEALVDDGWRLD